MGGGGGGGGGGGALGGDRVRCIVTQPKSSDPLQEINSERSGSRVDMLSLQSRAQGHFGSLLAVWVVWKVPWFQRAIFIKLIYSCFLVTIFSPIE